MKIGTKEYYDKIYWNKLSSVDILMEDYIIGEKIPDPPTGASLSYIKNRIKMYNSFELKDTDKVLQLGCGHCKESLFLAKKYKADFTCTDFSDYVLNESRGFRERLKGKLKGKVKIINEDATKLSFKDKSFDVIFVTDILEHLTDEDYYKCISETYRVLKDDGIVYVWSPMEEDNPPEDSSHIGIRKLRRVFRDLENAKFMILKQDENRNGGIVLKKETGEYTMEKSLNIMLVAPYEDGETGVYIANTLIDMKHRVSPFDFRVEMRFGEDHMNKKLIKDVKFLNPDLVIILKGIGIYKETITELKKICKVATWIFDVTLNGKMLKDVPQYIDFIKESDYFFTIAKGSVKELKELGVNAIWLKEGYYPESHCQIPANYFEKMKYSSDVVFCGTVGSSTFHEKRVKFLSDILDSEIDLKFYGDIPDKSKISDTLMSKYGGFRIPNLQHCIIIGSSKITLGMCGWPDVEESYSARIYRTLACGGFYLTNYVKGMENTFNIDVPWKNIKSDRTPDFVVYKDTEDCISKIFYYLRNEEERNRIKEQGLETVKKHSFKNRMNEMLDLIFKDDTEM